MQKSINIALLASILVLAAGLVYAVATRPATGPTQAEIEAMVAQAVDQRIAAEAPGELDTAGLGPLIEMYLMDNPRLLERMSVALEAEVRTEEMERARAALADLEDEIYNDPGNIVLGNPEGDVTLVEMFDYNCSYCRRVVADVMSLVEEDPGLRVILKEFPILSQGSVDAARIAVLVNKADVDYAAFHTALFSSRGAIDAEAAFAAAETLGLNRVELGLEMNAAEVTAVLQRNYALAQSLAVTGTPTFIIGDEIIPGAVEKSELVSRIANLRACGETVCS